VLPFHLLAASLLGAGALLACSSSHPPFAGAGAGTSGANNSGGNSGNGAGGATASESGRGNVAGSPLLDLDAGQHDDSSAGCARLNIGILGNPGANASSNFQEWLEKSGTRAQRIQINVDEPLTAATLQPFDVVVLDWLTREYTAEETATFAAWVSAGGGVASMTGYNNSISDFRANSLLAPLRVAYASPLRSGPVMNFVTHPVTAGLSYVTFNGGYAVSDLGGSESTRTAIAFLPDPADAVAGFAVQMGEGRAVVWGDEWIEFDSEWSTLPQITQFWVQLFAWIAPNNTCALTPPK